MNISLNKKIRAQDLKNLSFIKFSRERSVRVFKVYMFLAIPIGALIFTVRHIFFHGIPASGIESGYGFINLMMELGSAVHVFLLNMILGYGYLGVPLLLTSFWFAYRTYKRGEFGIIETVAVSLALTLIFISLLALLATFSISATYLEVKYFVRDEVALLAIIPISALICRWIARVFDINQNQ